MANDVTGKINNASYGVMCTMLSLFEKNLTMPELIASISKLYPGVEFNNFVASKYVNTCKSCGFDIQKINGKYSFVNFPVGKKFTDNEALLAYQLEEFSEDLKPSQINKDVNSFFEKLHFIIGYKASNGLKSSINRRIMKLYEKARDAKCNIRIFYADGKEEECFPKEVCVSDEGKILLRTSTQKGLQEIDPDNIIDIKITEKTNNETDRYANIYNLKEEYTVLLKDESLTQEDRKAMNQLRNGYKLILNTASGVGDASFDNEIRMNNRIISMRIIGQLFTYLVAQKLTFYGGEVPSTNTDGLYATGLSAELNEKALGEYAKNINVEIEPESLKIISKDSNNRIEFNPDTYKVYSASGGTLAGYFGYSADKALDHAPIIDRFLAEYMMREGVENDFDEDKMRKIIDECIEYKDSFEKLNYFAFIFSASGSSIRYPYAVTKDHKVKPLLKYNRGFLVKENTEGSCFMKVACVKKIGNNVKESRIRNGKAVEQIDLEAKDILKYWGEDLENLAGYDIISSKINRIDETDEVLIFNQNLHALSDEESEKLFALIDIDKYIHLTKLAYENNWQNKY